MITLKIHDISWVKGSEDDPNDQCSHGRVELVVNDTPIVKPEDGNWTVSAAALFLLRTLSFDHSFNDSVTENSNCLFPCCGFNIYPYNNRFKLAIVGCPNGVEVDIHHSDGAVTLATSRGHEAVTETEWKSAVLGFVAQVRRLYNGSAPKQTIQDSEERLGWELFWQEWEERVKDATAI